MAIDGIQESAVANFIQEANDKTDFGKQRAVVDEINVSEGTIRWHVESKTQRVVRFFVPNTTKRQNQQFAAALEAFKDTALKTQTAKIDALLARVDAQPKLGSTNPLKFFNALQEGNQPNAQDGLPSFLGRQVTAHRGNQTSPDTPSATQPFGRQGHLGHDIAAQQRPQNTPAAPDSQTVSNRPAETVVHHNTTTAPTAALVEDHSLERTPTHAGISNGHATLRSSPPDQPATTPQTAVVKAFVNNTVTTASTEADVDASLAHRATQTSATNPLDYDSDSALLLSEVLTALEAVQYLQQQRAAGSIPSQTQLQEAFSRLDALQAHFNELQTERGDSSLGPVADTLAALHTATTSLLGGQVHTTNSATLTEPTPPDNATTLRATQIGNSAVAGQQPINATEAYECIRADYHELFTRIENSVRSPNAIDELLTVRDHVDNALEPAVLRYIADHPHDRDGGVALQQQLAALNRYLNRVTQDTLEGRATTTIASRPENRASIALTSATAGPQHRSIATPQQPIFYREQQSQQFCSIAALNAFAGEPVLNQRSGPEALKKAWTAELPNDPDQFREKATAIYDNDFNTLLPFLDQYNDALANGDENQIAELRESLALARFTRAIRLEFSRNPPKTIDWDTPFTSSQIGGIPEGDVIRLGQHSDIGKNWTFNAPVHFSRNTPSETRQQTFAGIDRALVNRNGHWVTYRKTGDERWFEVNSSDEKGEFSEPPKVIDPATALAGLTATVITARSEV